MRIICLIITLTMLLLLLLGCGHWDSNTKYHKEGTIIATSTRHESNTTLLYFSDGSTLHVVDLYTNLTLDDRYLITYIKWNYGGAHRITKIIKVAK